MDILVGCSIAGDLRGVGPCNEGVSNAGRDEPGCRVGHMKTLVCVVLILCCGIGATAQTTQPAAQIDRGALEVRATQEFNRGQYLTALPMLKKLAQMTQDAPDQLGPIQEKIRVCERNIAANT